jgi:hypothetical protein
LTGRLSVLTGPKRVVGKVDPLKAADDLRREASKFIHSKGFDKILNSYGRVFYTGSYYLDLMVWPDLDIEISLNEDPYSVETFFQLGSEIAQLARVKSMKFNNCLDAPDTQAIPPKGLYWKIQASRSGNLTPWKVDLWAFDEATLERHEKEMKGFAARIARIDDDKRKRIIELKHSLLTSQGRTPISCGYYIYQAVLLEGIEDREEVIRYLRSKGVEVEL